MVYDPMLLFQSLDLLVGHNLLNGDDSAVKAAGYLRREMYIFQVFSRVCFVPLDYRNNDMKQ